MLKSKKQWSLCKFNFKKLYKVAVISNFLAFIQFIVDKFTLLAPDPGGKMNEDPCGSGSMRLRIHSPAVMEFLSTSLFSIFNPRRGDILKT